MNRVLRVLAVVAVIGIGVIGSAASAQTRVNTTPTREALDEATRDDCEGVSVIVVRCAPKPDQPAAKTATDPLTKSRATTKAAFDRRDNRGRAAALGGTPAPASTAVGDANRLGGVTVTGAAGDKDLSIQETLQRALNPNTEGTLSEDGKTISRPGLNGSRYDCVAKCVGPACCVEVRAMPNPSRDLNAIGR